VTSVIIPEYNRNLPSSIAVASSIAIGAGVLDREGELLSEAAKGKFES
jgi:hypothetical protein